MLDYQRVINRNHDQKPPSLMLRVTTHPPGLPPVEPLAELRTPRMEAARFWDLADDVMKIL